MMKEDSSPSRTKKPKAMPRKAHGGQSHINGDAPDGAFEEVEANASLRRGGSFKAPSLKYCSSKYFAGAAAAGASNFETTSPSRSHSCRRPRRPRDLEISSREYRPRALSMPSKGMHGRPRHPEHADDSESGAIGPDNVENNDDEYLMKVRSFTLSSKGLKNRGDSTKRKSRSNQSVKSSENYVMTEQEFRERASSVTSMGSGAHCDSSSDISGDGEVPPYKVVMLGAPKVGRTALARQFLTSEYLGAFDTSIDDGIEKSVSVLLDGKETEMRILEPPAEQQETGLHGDADAVIMVYSLADRASYQYATDVLFKLRNDYVSDQAIILSGE
ncbi:uncharacterized protein LOC106173709 isoform X1 [Lingula anatina]|uniref:Uncharacterized protein LOC106173709 isoform X1 n=2 Tax=Lingula anatina TaxID=7574 RepID=A0A1S3JJQ8_LINAN|nr:uncharacterized protein LOC106173709 isoform X1 [Lingula anatina]XP_023932719.1 uncharacterized protein LOC106173709 isoform X1 [Lingula anatina]|eukprot:XP_013410371.1 uncharacterized protein LOC106173709 isoform X1 [Lingula anatina]